MPQFEPHALADRLGTEKVRELARRAEAGESVRSLAREARVSASALVRTLRAEGVEISKRKVGEEEAARLKVEYEAGATMRELEKNHGLSHGAVFRALKRMGVGARPSAPRDSNK